MENRQFRQLTPFGKLVKKMALDKGVSMAQLAAAVGTTPQYLSNILTGTRPGEKYLPAIVAELGIDPALAAQVRAA